MPSGECLTESLDDIEDMWKIFEEDSSIGKNKSYKNITVHRKIKQDDGSKRETPLSDSIIPGTQAIYIKTWGCTHNSSDSEYMAGLLASFGYIITDNKLEANLWLLNSCTVKNPAEDHFRNEIKAAQSHNKFLVVAGCVSQAAPHSSFLQGLSIIGVHQIDRVVEVVEETLKGYTVRLLGQKKENGRKKGGASLLLPKIRKNPLIEIIPINTGCLNQCTYCKTRHARGHLGSYPIQEIVDRAVQAFNEGVCEIWLTSEDTGAYGRDIGVSLPELLWELVKVIPQGCMLRIGMTNPPYILEHLEEIAKIFHHPCVYAFLHVPVQSGSDQVLADMKREYSVAEFEQVVDFLREKVPGITIATDLICGFPTETEEDFDGTMALVKKYKFPSLFINQFYPRPNTPAAKLPRIPTNIVKQRTKRVSELFQSIFPYSNKTGEIHSILVTETSRDNQHYVGHNKFYEQILIPKEDDYLGKKLDVEIISTGKHYMMGRILKNGISLTPSIQPLLHLNNKNTTDIVDHSSRPSRTVLIDAIYWKMFLFMLLISIIARFLIKYLL